MNSRQLTLEALNSVAVILWKAAFVCSYQCVRTPALSRSQYLYVSKCPELSSKTFFCDLLIPKLVQLISFSARGGSKKLSPFDV